MNRSKTRTCARFSIIPANGKVEQHILIFDPAELPSLKVNAFSNYIQATGSTIISIYVI